MTCFSSIDDGSSRFLVASFRSNQEQKYILGNFHGVAEGGAFNDVGSVFRVTGCLF